MDANAAAEQSPGRDKYLGLVQNFPLRPIRTEEELGRATAVLNGLLDRARDPWEDDYLEVLGDLIERYEAMSEPEGGVSDAQMLAHLIEAKGVTQAEAAAGTGIVESTISAILRGKRRLARRHLEPLAAFFHVSPAVFLPGGPRARSRPAR